MSHWTHTHSFTLPAAPSRVFAALTTAAELEQWFAEHVEVDARAGGVFRSWGRFTYGAPSKTTGGPITVYERARVLTFEWTFDGVPSRVSWALDRDPADAEKTKPALTHAFDHHSGISYERELVDDLWRLTMGNLDAHLRGGSGIVRPDFTNSDAEIRMSIVIDAPREKVFRALTDPEALAKWFSLPSSKRLVTDWLDWRGDSSRKPQRLAWLLESVGGKTKVTLVHDGFERPADLGDHPFGWVYFLDGLKNTAGGTKQAILP